MCWPQDNEQNREPTLLSSWQNTPNFTKKTNIAKSDFQIFGQVTTPYQSRTARTKSALQQWVIIYADKLSVHQGAK